MRTINLHAGAGKPIDPLRQLYPRAIEDLSACRTPVLGGRVEQCSCCGQREYLCNSCRNRNCPKCQAGCRAAWLDREASYLLPVEYHHLVFTLPQAVAELARHNPRLIYSWLYEAASQSVRQAASEKGTHPGQADNKKGKENSTGKATGPRQR